jgi:protein TonB
VVVANPNAAPVEAPREIKPEPPKALVTQTAPIAGGIPGGAAPMLAAPPPPPPSAPVRVGGEIQAPKKIHDVPPQYPAVARQAKISGIVIIDAIIGKDGSVRDAKVLRGNPLLNQAATDAVTQWKYTPTLLNGQPVEVAMTVTVTFSLQ